MADRASQAIYLVLGLSGVLIVVYVAYLFLG
jgi:uncharacterized membrane protein YuzA (DUF378 family)